MKKYYSILFTLILILSTYSNNASATGLVSYTLSSNIESVQINESFTVSFTIPTPTLTSWIGAYNPSTLKNEQFTDWKYINSCSKTAGETTSSFGECSFTLTTPGTYEFRLFADNDYRLVATMPNKITILEPKSEPERKDMARCLSNVFPSSNPFPSTMKPGQSQNVSVTFENNGSTTWETGLGYYLYLTDWGDKNSKWSPITHNLVNPVAPGQNVTFNFNLVAPQTPGAHSIKYQMVRGGVAIFGETCGRDIIVQKPPEPIQENNHIVPVTVDAKVSGIGGTFQSYNQKVVTNQYGIFITYLHSDNGVAYDQNVWRLARSTDGGKTFSTIYEATHGTNPPVIETDSSGTIYLIHPDWGGGTKSDSWLYRFSPANNFANPTTTIIPNSMAGKYSMEIDENRNQLYYFSHNSNYFGIIGLDGVIKSSYKITQPGSNAILQYPMLYLASNGDLYAAWTTSNPVSGMYRDIHYMRSKDGGLSWETKKGTKLTAPIIADDSGPTDRITLNDEFDVYTWLSTFVIKNNKAHFVYWAQMTPSRQHYMRFDLTTGEREIDMQNWKGDSTAILNLDGFCATKKSDPNSYLYCASRSIDNRIAIIYSSDNGASWHDLAKTAVIPGNPHQIGGAREISADGYMSGTYSEINSGVASVKFFRVSTSVASGPSIPSPSIPVPNQQTTNPQVAPVAKNVEIPKTVNPGTGDNAPRLPVKNTENTSAPVASSTTPYNFGAPTLKNESRGEPVKELQRFLNQDLNLGLAIDGKLGPKTIAVVKTWQKNHGLIADGLVGPKTKAMMNASAR